MQRKHIDKSANKPRMKPAPIPPSMPPLPPEEGGKDVVVSPPGNLGKGSSISAREHRASAQHDLANDDVDSDARDAAPTNADEALALEASEQVGGEHGAVTRKKKADDS